MRQVPDNVKITHTTYAKADFYTGNAFSNHQYSVIISTKKDDQPGISEEVLKFHIDQVKPYITDEQYNSIHEAAMSGKHLTVYVIRNKGIKQGVFVLDYTGEKVFHWPASHRMKTLALMENVIEIISYKSKTTYQTLFEKGREHQLMC